MDGRARTSRSALTRTAQIETLIDAPVATVWRLLTDAAAFPTWNSTVTSIEGTIAAGQQLRIRVPVSERTFSPKVVTFEPESRMVWADGQAPFFVGRRTFELTATGSGVAFSMTETFRGIMVPLAARSLPDFGPIFEQYAADLKLAAERAAQEVS